MSHMLTRSLDRAATMFVLVVAAFGVLIPLSNLLLPSGSAFQVPTYLVALFGKYVCYAIAAFSRSATARSSRSAAMRWACI